MHRLANVILFTPDLPRMRAFYAGTLGLPTGTDQPPHWVDFATRGAALALHPTRDGIEPQVQLSFAVEDLEFEVSLLRERGVVFEDEIEATPHGRQIHLRDPEGNWLSLVQPASPVPEAAAGPVLRSVILNVRDLPGAAAFYRERLQLPVALNQPHWVELETGGTRVALHPRTNGLNHPLHAAQRVAPCFEAEDLDAWSDAIRARGAAFATSPTDEDFGLYAEVIDPDGNVIVFREPADRDGVEEDLAAPFEEGEVTHPVGMRPAALKRAKAVSRVALKPEYHDPGTAASRSARKKPSATTRKVASVRGAGPDRTRLAPTKTGDERKAKQLPAQGNRKRADASRATNQRAAGAEAGRTKPVKGAAPSRPRRP